MNSRVDTRCHGVRSDRRHRAPYSWLGAGAVTLGVGTALALGPGVAHADDTSGGRPAHSGRAESPASSRPADSSTPSPGGVTRGPRGSFSSSGAMLGNGRAPRAAASARESSAPVDVRTPDPGNATPRHIEVVPAVSVVPAAPLSRGADTTESVRLSRVPAGDVETAAAATVSTPTSSVPKTAVVVTSGLAARAALGPDPAASAVAVVPSAVAAPSARAVPTLPPGLGRLLYRIVVGRGLNTPTAPGDPFGALLWGMFRRIETVYGLVPVPGTPWMSSPSLTSGAVSGQVGLTVPAELPLGYSLVTAPTQGAVTVDSTGYYVYKPAATATAATDSFTVLASTGWAATNVTVTVPVEVPITIPGSASDAISIGAQPIDIAFTTDGRHAYVTGSTDTWTGQGTVSVIETATKTVIATVGNGAIPTGIAASTDGRIVYVSVYARGDITAASVLAIDTSTNATAAIGAGRFPAGVVVSPDGNTAYVLDAYINEGDDSVWVIDTSTQAVLAKVGVGSDPHGMAISPDGSHVYVVNRGNGSLGSATMSVIDTDPGSATVNTVAAVLKVGDEPVGLAVSPDGKHLYVSDLHDGAVRVIDTATNEVSATIPLGATVGGIAVSPDGKRVYVADAQGVIAVIDTVTNTLTGAIPVAGGPVGVAVSPDGSQIYVVKNYDQSVSVISI